MIPGLWEGARAPPLADCSHKPNARHFWERSLVRTMPQTDQEKLPQSKVTVSARGHQVPQTVAEKCSALRSATLGAPCLLAPLTIQEGKGRDKRRLGFAPAPPEPPRVERPDGQRPQQTNNFKAAQPSLGKRWRLERVSLPQGAWRLGAGWVS